MFKLLLATIALFLMSACSEQKIPKGTQSTQMKCGAGKCGANMLDDKSVKVDNKKKSTAMKCATGKCGK